MTRCVIYNRVSTKDQAQGKSLDSMLAECEAHARDKGWTVVKIFTEPGMSAKTDQRPAFREMLQFCRKPHNRIEYVLFNSFSRFMRNVKKGYRLLDEFDECRCQIASATEPIPEGIAGTVLLNNYFLSAEIDNSMRSSATKRVMKHLARSGYWPHQAPYGFQLARDASGAPILEPHPGRAPFLVHIFTEIAAGHMAPVGATEYLRSLRLEGARGVTSRFSLFSVHRMLRNEIYCGRIRSTLTDGIAYPARFPGLVSEDLFDRVQAVLSGRPALRLMRRKVRDDFPLRGFILCDCCGLPLTASWSKGDGGRYAYYRCRKNCPGAGVRGERLEKEFEQLLHDVRSRSGRQLALFRLVMTRTWQQVNEVHDHERRRLKQEMATTEQQAKALLDHLLEGTITSEVYKRRDQELKSALAQLGEKLEAAQADAIDIAEVLRRAEILLEELPRAWRRANVADKQKFQLGIFQGRISWHREKGFGTALTHNLFSILHRISPEISPMASPTARSWNLAEVVDFAKGILELTKAA